MAGTVARATYGYANCDAGGQDRTDAGMALPIRSCRVPVGVSHVCFFAVPLRRIEIIRRWHQDRSRRLHHHVDRVGLGIIRPPRLDVPAVESNRRQLRLLTLIPQCREIVPSQSCEQGGPSLLDRSEQDLLHRPHERIRRWPRQSRRGAPSWLTRAPLERCVRLAVVPGR